MKLSLKSVVVLAALCCSLLYADDSATTSGDSAAPAPASTEPGIIGGSDGGVAATGFGYGYSEFNNSERENAYTAEPNQFSGNVFMEEGTESSEGDESHNLFLGEPETVGGLDSYNQTVSQDEELSKDTNTFLGVGYFGDDSGSDFEFEYNRLSNQFWKQKTTP